MDRTSVYRSERPETGEIGGVALPMATVSLYLMRSTGEEGLPKVRSEARLLIGRNPSVWWLFVYGGVNLLRGNGSGAHGGRVGGGGGRCDESMTMHKDSTMWGGGTL